MNAKNLPLLLVVFTGACASPPIAPEEMTPRLYCYESALAECDRSSRCTEAEPGYPYDLCDGLEDALTLCESWNASYCGDAGWDQDAADACLVDLEELVCHAELPESCYIGALCK